MAPSISTSISELADQVANLAKSVDRLVSIAEASRQRLPARKKLAKPKAIVPADGRFIQKTTSEADLCLLAPREGESPIQSHHPAENVIAASVADLYDRLGGLLGAALQPNQDAGSLEKAIAPLSANAQ